MLILGETNFFVVHLFSFVNQPFVLFDHNSKASCQLVLGLDDIDDVKIIFGAFKGFFEIFLSLGRLDAAIEPSTWKSE